MSKMVAAAVGDDSVVARKGESGAPDAGVRAPCNAVGDPKKEVE